MLKFEDVKPIFDDFDNCYKNARDNGKVKVTDLEDIYKSIINSNESVCGKIVLVAFFGGPGSGKSLI